jgi:transcriptional regulator with XRE-family HTH domain
MMDISYNKWVSMSDVALSRFIGNFIQHHRLQQNKTQSEVAELAGISRSTLSLLERGETVTIATLLQVLRTLDLLYVMEAFEVVEQQSPLALAKLQQQKRKRASGTNDSNSPQSNW